MKYLFLLSFCLANCDLKKPETPSDQNQLNPTPKDVVVSEDTTPETSPQTQPKVENQPSKEEESVVVEVKVIEPEPIKWIWPLPHDDGIRIDSDGNGWFGASRGTYKHYGLDLKAPIGTPVLAICPGEYITGNQRPYGKFSRLICEIPDQDLWISVMYAHLSKVESTDNWKPTQPGDKIGYVGKSGNASDKNIESHLHIEIRVWPDEKGARTDDHSLRDSGSRDSKIDNFGEDMQECAGHIMTDSGIHIDHKFDPWYILNCYGKVPQNGDVNGKQWADIYKGIK